jgi:hypothetical protein
MKRLVILIIFLAQVVGMYAQGRRLVNYTAKSVLRKTVEASGGDTWQQPQTLQLNGDAVWTPYGLTDSAHKIDFDQYQMYRIFPAVNDAARKANGKIRFDAKYGDSLYLQLIFDSAVTRNYLSERAKPYQKYFSWANNFGFSIIRFADRDSFLVEKLTSDAIDGNGCYVIRITDPKKFETTFWIDQKTFYIRSVGFKTDLGWHHRIYSDFEKLDAGRGKFFVQPRRLRIYFEGIKWMDVSWRKNIVNQPIADGVFNPQ